MNVKALLDVDMVALEAADKVTLMLDLTAPANPAQLLRVVGVRPSPLLGFQTQLICQWWVTFFGYWRDIAIHHREIVFVQISFE